MASEITKIINALPTQECQRCAGRGKFVGQTTHGLGVNAPVGKVETKTCSYCYGKGKLYLFDTAAYCEKSKRFGGDHWVPRNTVLKLLKKDFKFYTELQETKLEKRHDLIDAQLKATFGNH